jgi:hypothetical protein
MAKRKTKPKDSTPPTETPAEEQPTAETQTPTEEAIETAPDPAEAALDAAEAEEKDKLQDYFGKEDQTELDLDEPIEEVTREEAVQEAAPPQEEEETPLEEPTPKGEEAPPAEPPTPPVEEPVPEAAPPAEEPPAETPTAPVPEPAPVLSAEEVQQQYQTWRGQQEAQLAAHHYAIDEETAQRLNDEPGVAIPQLMARVHVDSMVSTLGYVANQLPAMIDQAIARRETRSGDEEKFFDRWPDLKAGEHGEAIGLIGNAYRHANPGATPEQFIRDVGAQAMVAFGLALGNTPLVQEPEPTPAQVPFTPANASPPSAGAPPQPSGIAKADKEMFEQGDDLDLD